MASNTTVIIPLANSSIAGLLLPNNGIISNSSGTFVNANNGLVSTSTGVSVNANTGLISNSSGLFAIGDITLLDSITGSFNSACTVFTLANHSSAVVPNNPQSLIVVLDGVYQQPNTSYTVSGSNITFTSAPDAEDTCFMIMMGSLSSGAAGNLPNTISVKSYGATGDGVTDDTAAIQAAANAAFQYGNGMPHGVNSYLNQKLYFPAGTYIIWNPIQFGPIYGAEVFGDGMNTSIIWNKSTSNATFAQGCFATDGCAYSTFRDFTLKGIVNDANSVLFDYSWTTFSSVTATQCLFENIEFFFGGYGCRVGAGSQGQCDDSTWVKCKFHYNYTAGIQTCNSASVGHSLFGCESMGCGIGVYCNTGQMNVYGCSFEDQGATNFISDIYYANNDIYDAAIVSGCSSESRVFVTAGGRPVTIQGCEHRNPGANVWFFYGLSASPQTSGPYNISACVSHQGGINVANGCIINFNGFQTNILFSNWLIIENPTHAYLSFKNCGVITTGAPTTWSLWDMEWSTFYSMIPDPRACSGQRGIIHDANVSTWGAVVNVGNGTFTTPIWSNGTNWLVG